MSLDLYVISPEPIKKTGTGVYVRKNGETVELKTIEEVKQHFPDADISSIEEKTIETDEFWHGNITHNLGEMAKRVFAELAENSEDDLFLYDLLWDNKSSIQDRWITIYRLATAIRELESNPEEFKRFNPENGWGTYEQLLQFTKEFLKAVVNAPEGSYIEIDK